MRFDRLERLLGGDGVRVPTDAPAGEESTVGENRGRPDEAPPVHWIALCSPLGLTCGYALLGLAVGSNPVDATAPGWSRAVAVCLLVALLLDAGWTTGRLFEDAGWWRDRSTSWTPNPFGYVTAGTLCLVLVHVAVTLHAGSIERPERYAGGVLLAAIAFSSIVSGPLYALQRRRSTGV